MTLKSATLLVVIAQDRDQLSIIVGGRGAGHDSQVAD
jgi:hypothetical protein